MNNLEALRDPKETLYSLMRDASGHRGRRLDRFNRKLGSRLQQLAERIDDFRPLRGLAAFRRLEGDIEPVVKEKGWGRSS